MAIPGLQSTVLAMVFGVTSYTVARRLKIPAILFYLLAGLAAGPMGLGIIDTADLGPALLTLVEIAVAVILFEGGLSLKSQEFHTLPAAIRRILILTIPLTALSAFALSWTIMGLSWDIAVVFGALIVVTGPTVIGPLLKSVRLTPRLEILLLWESIWGDVIGVLLTALALEFLFLSETTSFGGLGLELGMLILDGLIIGLIGGFLLGRFILPWASKLGDPGIPGIITFTAALAVFYFANLLMDSAGPLAAAVAGFVLSQQRGAYLQGVRHFKDQISVIFIATLFVLLSAHVNLFDFSGRFWSMLFVAFVLGALVRPLSVILSLTRTGLSLREQLYIGLIGPRGIVALAAASYAALMIPGRQEEMELLMNTVFVIILFSGAFTTLAGRSLASWLDLIVSRSKSGLLVVGANPFSLKLVEFARSLVPVAFLDTSRSSCQLLEDQGHITVCPDVLDDEVYEQAKEEGYDRLLALTHDDALNQLICEKAAIHFGEHNVAMAKGNTSEDLMIEPISNIDVVFTDNLTVAEAIRGLNQGRATIEVLEEYHPQAGLFPLLRETDDHGLEVIREAPTSKGRVLCLRVNIEQAEQGSVAEKPASG